MKTSRKYDELHRFWALCKIQVHAKHSYQYCVCKNHIHHMLIIWTSECTKKNKSTHIGLCNMSTYMQHNGFPSKLLSAILSLAKFPAYCISLVTNITFEMLLSCVILVSFRFLFLTYHHIGFLFYIFCIDLVGGSSKVQPWQAHPDCLV